MRMPRLHLECLGVLRLTLGKQPLVLSPKAQALLCYLAMSERAHPREALAGLLWGEFSEEAARANLRTMLSKLRQSLRAYLAVSHDTVAFNHVSSYRLDVEPFLDNLTGLEAEADSTRLRAAVKLYRGDFLEGFHIGGAPLFEEWLLGQRERLKQLAVHAFHSLAAHHTEQQDYTAATDYLSRLIGLEPWREDSHRQLMTMLALSGQRDAALRQFEACRRILREELGFEPSAPTVELYERIKAGEINVRRPAIHNLPLLPSALIGRHEELTYVAQLLATSRLVTLTGPGGVGKTSLALQAARQALTDFVGGVFFVSLAALESPELVTAAIAQALNVQEATGQPLLAIIKTRLQSEPTLLLLDNFEHLLPAAPIVAELLAHCPELKVMTTSRAVLALRSEHAFEVPPLAVPDLRQPLRPDLLEQYSAVALFCERAKAVKPNFELGIENAAAVATICVRLDGLPLAIELAAAHVKFMSLGVLLVRLGNRLKLLTGGARDLPLRQQTLRHTIAWSYELLEPDVQRLFARLAVFTGSFSLEAAEEICTASSPDLESFVGVAQLVDKSLLQREELYGEVRFKMLETIREYALARLEESGEAKDLCGRHAASFRDLAERAEREMKGAEQIRWLTLLETELDNIRAALGWALESGEQETGLRLAGALSWFWFMRGTFGEGRDWLEGMLSLRGEAPPHLRAKALYGAGMLARRQGDKIAAVQLEAGLELYQHLGDKNGVAACLHHLAHVAEEQGDYHQAIARFTESLALARETGDLWELTLSLHCLGHMVHEHGDDAWATALLEESLSLCQKIGNRYGIGDALRLLGLIALRRGDSKQAAEQLEGSLALSRELGNKQGMALIFPDLARASLHEGDVLRAKNLLRQGLALHSEGGRLGLTKCLRGLAEVAFVEGNLKGVARFLGAAEAVHETSGIPGHSYYLNGFEELAVKARAALGQQLYAVAWIEGRTMSVGELTTLTLTQT